MQLTEKQKHFADEYLIHLDAARAYQATYDNSKSAPYAARAGSRLLQNARIGAYLDKRRQVLQQDTGITQERVLQEYARLAFFDVRRLFGKDGKPLEIAELDEDTAAAVAGIEVSDVYEGRGKDKVFVGFVKKYKIADKKGALDSLARHLGLFNDKVECKGDIRVELAGEVKEWAK